MFRQLDYLADILLLLPGLQRQEPSYISTSLGAVQAPAGRIAAAFGFGWNDLLSDFLSVGALIIEKAKSS